jgi:hypothetical protein
VFKILDKDNDKRIDLEEYEKMYENQELVFGWFEYLNQDEVFMKDIVSQTEILQSKELKLEKIKSSIGSAMQVLMNIENCKTPVDRTRSPTPVKRSNGLSSPSKNPFAKKSANGSFFSNSGQSVLRGSITTNILTSKVVIDKGFTGPKFIEDDIAYNIPLGDEIPDYFAEDFDFSIDYPLKQTEFDSATYQSQNYDVEDM